MPKISIITAVYNGEKYLQGLIDSILAQHYADYEFIVIDGGSKDKTVQIIQQNEQHIAYWISEKDKGIYDAWNKGVKAATGDWIMFLGCDDALCPGALESYAHFIATLPNKEQLHLVSSKIRMVTEQGSPLGIRGEGFIWPKYLRTMTVAHPGALHSRKLFSDYGLYNIDYKIVGDYELLLRAGAQLQSAFLDTITVNMRAGGVSESLAAIKEHYRAATQVGKSNKLAAFINGMMVYAKLSANKFLQKFKR